MRILKISQNRLLIETKYMDPSSVEVRGYLADHAHRIRLTSSNPHKAYTEVNLIRLLIWNDVRQE